MRTAPPRVCVAIAQARDPRPVFRSLAKTRDGLAQPALRVVVVAALGPHLTQAVVRKPERKLDRTQTEHKGGTLTEGCKSILGDTELEGGWAVVTIDRLKRVSVAELESMCVDRDRGYVPSESWTDAGGRACSCGEDYSVDCE